MQAANPQDKTDGTTAAQVGAVAPPNIPYSVSNAATELRQSEIIANLDQHIYHPVTKEAQIVKTRFAIILAQDCDLLRDFEARAKAKPEVLNSVLIYELMPWSEARGKITGVSLERIQKNTDERYHFLGAVLPEADLLGTGLPELLIDFRRYFSLTAAEIYRQCGLPDADAAKRRCHLKSPYREHLQQRAGFYFQRVAL